MCSREFFCELYTYFFFLFPFSLLPQSSETESLTTLDRLVCHPFLCTNECVSERQTHDVAFVDCFFVFQVTFASLHSGHCMADDIAKCKDEAVCRFFLYAA